MGKGKMMSDLLTWMESLSSLQIAVCTVVAFLIWSMLIEMIRQLSRAIQGKDD